MSARAEFRDGAIVLEAHETGLSITTFHLTPREAQRLARDLSHALIESGVLRSKQRADAPAPPARCPGKRGFESEEKARASAKSADWRFRAYECPGCGAWHLTADEKNARRRGVQKGSTR